MLVPAVPDPLNTKLSTLDKSMHQVLRNNDTNDEKLKKFRKLMLNYLHYLRAESATPANPTEIPTTNEDSDTEFNTASDPPEVHNIANSSAAERQINDRVSAITHRPEIVNFNPSGELVYHGVTVPNTNILDLIGGQGEGQDIFDSGVREAAEDQAAKFVTDQASGSRHPSVIPKLRRQRRLNPYLRQTSQMPSMKRNTNESEWKIERVTDNNESKEEKPKEIPQFGDQRNTIVKTIENNDWQPINYLNETVDDFLPPRTSTPIPDHRNWETLKDTTGEALAALRRLRHLQNKRKALRQTGPSRKYARDIDDPAEIAMVDRFMRLQRKRRARTQLGPSRKYMREPHDLAERRDNLKHKMKGKLQQKKIKKIVKLTESKKARAAKTEEILSKIKRNVRNYISEDDGLKLGTIIRKARK